MPSLFIASIIYWVTILIALLNYGSVELLTVALLALPIFLLLLILLITQGLPEHTASTLWTSAILLVMLVAWVVIQSTPGLDLSTAQPAWKEVQQLLPDTQSAISLSPADDLPAALRIAVPFGVFMVGLLLFANDDRAVRALKVFSVSAGLISIFSIAHFYAAPDRLLFGEKIAYLTSLTGLFVNRNTAATFFGLALLLNATVVETSIRKIDIWRVLGAIGAGSMLSSGTQKKVWHALWHCALLFSSLTALMLTKSRGGIGATFVAVCFLFVLKMVRKSRISRKQQADVSALGRRTKMLVASCGFLLVLVIFFMFGQRVLLRSQMQDTFEDGRFCVMPGILSAVRDHFPFGAGLSSFSSVFPAYRDPSCGIIGAWDRAHNVYLEGLFTLGIVFVVPALVFVLWLTVVFLIGIRRRRSARFAGELGLSALLLVAVHSAIDFSLQISGLAIFFAAMLAPLVTLSLRPPGNGNAQRKAADRVRSNLTKIETANPIDGRLTFKADLFASSKIKAS